MTMIGVIVFPVFNMIMKRMFRVLISNTIFLVQLVHFVRIGMTTEVQRLASENLDCLRTLLVNTE